MDENVLDLTIISMMNDDYVEYVHINLHSKKIFDYTNTNDTDKWLEENLMLMQLEYDGQSHIVNNQELYKHLYTNVVDVVDVVVVELQDKLMKNEEEELQLLDHK